MTRRNICSSDATVVVEVEHLRHEDLPAAEGQQLPRQRRRAFRGCLDLVDHPAARGGVEFVASERLGVAADDLQQVVEVVREASREPAESRRSSAIDATARADRCCSGGPARRVGAARHRESWPGRAQRQRRPSAGSTRRRPARQRVRCSPPASCCRHQSSRRESAPPGPAGDPGAVVPRVPRAPRPAAGPPPHWPKGCARRHPAAPRRPRGHRAGGPARHRCRGQSRVSRRWAACRAAARQGPRRPTGQVQAWCRVARSACEGAPEDDGYRRAPAGYARPEGDRRLCTRPPRPAG